VKITNVTAHHLPGTRYPWVFLHIDTDAGIRGLGQVSSGPNSAMVAAAASRLGPLLIGEDPSRIEYLWHKLYAGFNSLGSHGFVSALISGVDIALWDIRGKALELPIYEATLHALAVPPGARAKAGRVHHARHHSHRRHL